MQTMTTVSSQRHEFFCLIFYAALLLVTLATLTATFINYHLFPFDLESLAWSNAWLLASTINYYGACLCFCGVVMSSERSWWTAIPWALACCVVGSPACCLYIFLFITKEGGTLRLERGALAMEMLAAAAAASGTPHREAVETVNPTASDARTYHHPTNTSGSTPQQHKARHHQHQHQHHQKPPRPHKHHHHRSQRRDLERGVVL